MTWQRLTVWIFISLLAACTKSEPGPADTGAALLAPFKANLKNELLTAMQSGPVEAMAVCNTAAPEIAASLSVDGVRMGRTSHKLRNPANAAPAWFAPLLRGWVSVGIHADNESELLSSITPLGDGRYGYAEPIYVQPLCLNCHGEELAPDVVAEIESLYPEDQATGFRIGDLRGAFWVEFVDDGENR